MTVVHSNGLTTCEPLIDLDTRFYVRLVAEYGPPGAPKESIVWNLGLTPGQAFKLKMSYPITG